MGIAIDGKKIENIAIGGKVVSGIAVSGISILNSDSGHPLDYIQSSGTQYINTEFVLPDTNSFQVEIEYQALNTGSPKYVYGADTSDYATNNFCFLREYDKIIIANRQSGHTEPLNSVELRPLSLSQWYSVVHRRDYVLINGTRYDYPKPEQQAKPTGALFLFATNRAGVPSVFESCRVKRFTIRMDDGSLYLNFIPYMSKDNVVCMKDTVSGNLILNSGTGVFLSPVVSDYEQALRAMGIQPDESSENSMLEQLELMGVR